jgi:hypothetical protein
MYVRVLQDELQFPDDRGMDQDTKSLIRGVSHCLPFGIELSNIDVDRVSFYNATLHSGLVSHE